MLNVQNPLWWSQSKKFLMFQAGLTGQNQNSQAHQTDNSPVF